MKKLLCILLSAVLLLALCACARESEEEPELSGEQELYEFGLEITDIMGQMVSSEEYAELMGAPESVRAIGGTGDYDSPTAVYAIGMPDTEELLDAMGYGDSEEYAGLSKDLKEQVENRVSLSAVITMINSAYGTDCLAFSSLFVASKKLDDLYVEESVSYLYVFESGTPIVVTFSDTGYANGHFLFAQELDSLSDVKDIFGEVGCTVKKVDTQ